LGLSVEICKLERFLEISSGPVSICLVSIMLWNIPWLGAILADDDYDYDAIEDGISGMLQRGEEQDLMTPFFRQHYSPSDDAYLSRHLS
jgi:hypothetical protein